MPRWRSFSGLEMARTVFLHLFFNANHVCVIYRASFPRGDGTSASGAPQAAFLPAPFDDP